MHAIGYSTGSMNDGHTAGPQEPNVISEISTMPVDGWLTYADVRAGGYEGSIRAKIGIWSAEGNNKRIYASAQQTWGYGRNVHGAPLPNIRMFRGSSFFRGFWRPQTDFAWWGLFSGVGQYHLKNVIGDIVDEYIGYATTFAATLLGQTYYVANAAPLRPQWHAGAPSGQIGERNPEFTGTLPHPASEGGRDHSTSVQAQIENLTTGQTHTLPQFNPANFPNPAGGWRKRLRTHEAGHSFRARFRHRDSFDVWSPWCVYTYYNSGSGPAQPVLTSPVGGEVLRTQNPVLAGTTSHPDGTGIPDVQVQTFNANGAILLQTSSWYNYPGSTQFALSYSTLGLTQEAWAVTRQWRARTRDSKGVVGDWSRKSAFSTNTAPFVPSNLSPTGGDITGSNLLSCVARDPDKDDIQSVTFQYRIPGGTATTVEVTGPFRNGSRVSYRPPLTYGNAYEWRARASDGTLSGSWADWQSFIYDVVPTVSMISPQQGGYTNAVSQPSAEYDPAEVGQRWTENGRVEPTLDAEGIPTGSYSTIDRVKDGDTPLVGKEWCWRAAYSGGSGVWFYASERMKANTATPGILTAWVKTEFGNPRSLLRVDCYGGSGTHKGSVYPDSIRVLNNGLPEDSWTRYGGTIPIGQWPAGTTQVEIRVYPNAGANADPGSGAVRFDAFLFQHDLPGGAAAGSDAWYGYSDGDTTGYGPGDDYYWTGLRGNSPSETLNRLTKPAAETTVRISYGGNSAKVTDRMVIEQWIGLEYKRLYGPLFPATNVGSRTTIPLPSNVIKNEGHYRLYVVVKDTFAQVAGTGWVYFDTVYTGPPEIPVEQVTSNEDEAKLSISWVPSELPAGEFSHYEIRTRSPSEGEITRLITGDQSLSQFEHHWPRSGEPYDFEVRQAQVVGSEAVDGPWRGGEVSVTYREVHLKDLDSPEHYRFSHPIEADNEPSQEFRANRASYRPRAARAAVHYVGEQRDMAGSFIVKIIDGLEARGKLDSLLELAERRSGVALLMPRPARVLFVSLDDIKETSTDIPYLAAYEISYEETHYLPDYILRELEAT